MRVVTRLVKTEFFIDKLYVDEHGQLVMENSEDEKMRVRAYMDASDVIAAIKNGLSLDVIKFVARAPLTARRTKRAATSTDEDQPRKYPTGGDPKP